MPETHETPTTTRPDGHPTMAHDSLYGSAGDERTAYAPPKAVSYGHVARRADPRQALGELESFLELRCAFTIRELVQLQVGIASGSSTEPDLTQQARAEATARFSVQPVQPGRWHLGPSERTDAIDFVLDLHRRWAHLDPPLSQLHFSYEFVWRDLIPSSVSSDQREGSLWVSDRSTLGVGLGFKGRRVFFTPMLLFPFRFDEPDFSRFLLEVEESLPFRLRDRYFRRILRSRAGGWGQVRQLDKGWRATLHERPGGTT